MFILIGLLHVLICYLYDTEIHFGKCEDDFHIKKNCRCSEDEIKKDL